MRIPQPHAQHQRPASAPRMEQPDGALQQQANHSPGVSRLSALQKRADNSPVIQRRKETAQNLQAAIVNTDANHTITTADPNATGALFEETFGLRTGHNYTINATNTADTTSAEKAQTAGRILAGAGSLFGKANLLKVEGVRNLLTQGWKNPIGKKAFPTTATKQQMADTLATNIAGANMSEKLGAEEYLKSAEMEVETYKPNPQAPDLKRFRIAQADPDDTAAISTKPIDKDVFGTRPFWTTTILSNGTVPAADPAILNLTITDQSGATMQQRVQFGYEWNTYITQVKETKDQALDYTGNIYNPTDQNAHGASDYSRSHHSDEGAGPIGTQANAVPDQQTAKTPVSVDAITKISAEGARWKLVLDNAATLTNETKIYAETGSHKFRYVTFAQLWASWSKPFDQQFGITNATVADKLRNDQTWDKVTQVDTEDAVAGDRIKVP